MAISRTRSAGAKLTNEEYAQLETLAQARGLTVGEWCREVLLAQANEPSPTLVEQSLMAEIMGLRMIVINLLNALVTGQELDQQRVEAVIRRAEMEKLPTALERLKEATNRRAGSR